jgi:opacity protein-like surface antigen
MPIRARLRGWPASLAAGLVLLIATTHAREARAQEAPPPSQPNDPKWDDSYYPSARNGAYVGLGGFYAFENFDRDAAIETQPLDISADDGGGIDLHAGYRFHPRFAAELLFQYYFEFVVKEKNSGENDKFDGWSATLNGKAYGLLGAVQPYALVGLGGLFFTEKQGEDAGFLARLGGGVDLYLTDHIVVEVEVGYALPAGDLDDFQFVTFGGGIQYRF